MTTERPVATRLRGIWMGVRDFKRSRSFYELLGAQFDDAESPDGMMSAILGGTRLVFEAGAENSPGTGPYLLFDVTDVDALYVLLQDLGYAVEGPPVDEPWGRQLNVLDPDGHSIALIGPAPP